MQYFLGEKPIIGIPLFSKYTHPNKASNLFKILETLALLMVKDFLKNEVLSIVRISWWVEYILQ